MRRLVPIFLSILFGGCLLTPVAAHADSVSYTGQLDPDDPNDFYLATFNLLTTSSVVIQSYGYGGSSAAPGGTNAAGVVIPAGGFDTYFSLFDGTEPSATFDMSNDDGGCHVAAPVNDNCEDSRLALTLAAGSYTLALTLPDNYSIAENYGYGTLGDGFIELQSDYYDGNSGEIRTSDFAFDISTTPTSGTAPPPPSAVTPEPASLVLLSTGLVFMGIGFRPRRMVRA